MIIGEEHSWFEDGHWVIDADFCKEGEPIIYQGNVLGNYDIKFEEWWDQSKPYIPWVEEYPLVPTREYKLPDGGAILVEFFSYRG